MKTGKLLFAFLILGSPLVYGYPSNRPLPERVTNENEDFLLLRDHEIANRFYLLPKTLTVVEHTVRGDTKPGCSALQNYHEGHATLVSTQLLLVKLNETTTRLLASNVELQQETAKLEKVRVNLEKEIRNATKLGLTEAEIASRRAELADTVAQIELNQKLEAQTTSNITSADNKATLLGLSIKGLQKDLDRFLDHLARPAVDLLVRASLPATPMKDPTFKAKFGLIETDTLALAPLSSLEYLSSADADTDFLAKIVESDLLTKFKPIWSPAPLVLVDTDYGKKTLAKDATLAEFPRMVEYRQSLTLYSFCNANLQEKASPEMLVGLSLSYRVPAFIDDKSEEESIPVLLSFRRALSDEAWAIFETLPSLGEAEPIGTSDQGDPRLFSGEGKFGVNKYNVRFLYSQNRVKVEVK